ncbi:MAG: methyltransferase domain-containing protein [Calditrichia bacterium]
MRKKLSTTVVRSGEDIRRAFDAAAHTYQEQHGNPRRLLHYRVKLIRKAADIQPTDTLLDIGCGTGGHLFALAESFGRGVGIDFSEEMIRVAQENLALHPRKEKITFQVDEAEKLHIIADNSIDVAMCVGAFEHMLQKRETLRTIHRVLKPGGRLVMLTPNGNYLWYTTLAPRFQIPTKHYSTDQFLTEKELVTLLQDSGFKNFSLKNWTFIPKGDIPAVFSILLQFLDVLGKITRWEILRGGWLVKAVK